MRVQQGTVFSVVLFKNDAQIDLLRSSIEENNQLYFVAVVEYKKVYFTSTMAIFYGFSTSNNISPPRRLFCDKHDNVCFIS